MDKLKYLITELKIMKDHSCGYGCNKPCKYSAQASFAENLLRDIEEL